MKKLGKITKGVWEVTDATPNGIEEIKEHIEIANEEYSIACCFSDISGYDKFEAQANAILIADAGTTANICAELPSTLLEQRDEAIKLLKEAYHYLPLMPENRKIVNEFLLNIKTNH